MSASANRPPGSRSWLSGGLYLALALIMVAGSVSLRAQSASPPAQAPQGQPSLNGLDFTGLTPAQVDTIMKVLNDTRCNCPCGMLLAECRVKDPNCPRSLPAARGVVQDVRDGKSVDVVRSNLQAALAKAATPPPAAPATPAQDPNKVFAIDVTGDPFKGPKNAPVTIVEFSDYQ